MFVELTPPHIKPNYIKYFLDIQINYESRVTGCIHSFTQLTAILDREAFTELHLSFRRSMMMMNPMLAASRLQTQDIHTD